MKGLFGEFANISKCTAFMYILMVVRFSTIVAIIITPQERFHTINDIKMVTIFL